MHQSGRRVSLRLIKGGAAASRMTGNVTPVPSWTGASGITYLPVILRNATGAEYAGRYSVLLRNSIVRRCSGTLKQGDYRPQWPASGPGIWRKRGRFCNFIGRNLVAVDPLTCTIVLRNILRFYILPSRFFAGKFDKGRLRRKKEGQHPLSMPVNKFRWQICLSRKLRHETVPPNRVSGPTTKTRNLYGIEQLPFGRFLLNCLFLYLLSVH